MDIRPIADGIAVAGQINADDISAIAEMGFRTVVSNRPDHEDGCVPHGEIRSKAEEAGLIFHYVPVVPGAITPQDVSDMAGVLESAEKPVLAYCRSGGRCLNLLQLVEMATGQS